MTGYLRAEASAGFLACTERAGKGGRKRRRIWRTNAARAGGKGSVRAGPRARGGPAATPRQRRASAKKVLAGEPLDSEIDRALHHGSSIGRARPKALPASGDRKRIAKFSASPDTCSVVKAEYIPVRLAALCSIDAAPVDLVSVSGKDILLAGRFGWVAAPLPGPAPDKDSRPAARKAGGGFPQRAR
jgi:hypothetical protein